MNKRLKNELKKAFEPPKPKRKEEFLSNIKISEIGYLEFLRLQISYIGKLSWLMSFIIFFACLICAKYFSNNIIWSVSALMPMLAMIFVTEIKRSDIYGMSEIEQSTRFSLKSVILSRLLITGLLNLVLMCIIIPIASINSSKTILQTGVCIFLPYLLVIFLSLFFVRRIRGKETVYICLSISVIISVLSFICYESMYYYIEKNIGLLLLMTIIFSIGSAVQIFGFIKKEDFICS